MRLINSILVILLLITDVSGQKDSLRSHNDTLADKFFLLQNVERDGIKMPEVEIKEVAVVARPSRSMRADYRKYQRLISNIKRVYPYATMVRQKLNKVNQELTAITNEKERRAYIKNVEKDVFGEYEDDMRQLTMTQGRLLIKLIDRETQNTSYTLIREYRGWFSAAFWQGIARIFGTNLKDEYDAYGEDALIELIIWEIDSGRL